MAVMTTLATTFTSMNNVSNTLKYLCLVMVKHFFSLLYEEKNWALITLASHFLNSRNETKYLKESALFICNVDTQP